MPGLGGPLRIDVRIEGQWEQVDAVQRIGQAALLSRFRANQRLPYHLRMASRIWPSLILKGSRLCGVIASPYHRATMAGEPQKSQLCRAGADRH